MTEKTRQLHVITEAAIVYRGTHRRFFTKDAAYREAARTELLKREPCECESGDPEAGDGFLCDWHDASGKLQAQTTVLAAQYMAEDQARLRTVGGDDDGP